MLFQMPRKFTVAQIALMPIALPVLAFGLAVFTVAAVVKMAKTRLREFA